MIVNVTIPRAIYDCARKMPDSLRREFLDVLMLYLFEEEEDEFAGDTMLAFMELVKAMEITKLVK